MEAWATVVLAGPCTDDAQRLCEVWDQWVADTVSDLPAPAGGRTWSRWASLAHLAALDGPFAALALGHADAVALVQRLQPAERLDAPGRRWGFWGPGTADVAVVARPSGDVVVVTPTGPAWSVATDAVIVLPAGGEHGDRVVRARLSPSVDAVGPVELPLAGLPVLGTSFERHPLRWVLRTGPAALWWGAAEQLFADVAAVRPQTRQELVRSGLAWAALGATGALLQHTATAFDTDDWVHARDRALRSRVSALATLRAVCPTDDDMARMTALPRARAAWGCQQLALHEDGGADAEALAAEVVVRPRLF